MPAKNVQLSTDQPTNPDLFKKNYTTSIVILAVGMVTTVGGVLLLKYGQHMRAFAPFKTPLGATLTAVGAAIDLVALGALGLRLIPPRKQVHNDTNNNAHTPKNGGKLNELLSDKKILALQKAYDCNREEAYSKAVGNAYDKFGNYHDTDAEWEAIAVHGITSGKKELLRALVRYNHSLAERLTQLPVHQPTLLKWAIEEMKNNGCVWPLSKALDRSHQLQCLDCAVSSYHLADVKIGLEPAQKFPFELICMIQKHHTHAELKQADKRQVIFDQLGMEQLAANDNLPIGTYLNFGMARSGPTGLFRIMDWLFKQSEHSDLPENLDCLDRDKDSLSKLSETEVDELQKNCQLQWKPLWQQLKTEEAAKAKQKAIEKLQRQVQDSPLCLKELLASDCIRDDPKSTKQFFNSLGSFQLFQIIKANPVEVMKEEHGTHEVSLSFYEWSCSSNPISKKYQEELLGGASYTEHPKKFSNNISLTLPLIFGVWYEKASSQTNILEQLKTLKKDGISPKGYRLLELMELKKYTVEQLALMLKNSSMKDLIARYGWMECSEEKLWVDQQTCKYKYMPPFSYETRQQVLENWEYYTQETYADNQHAYTLKLPAILVLWREQQKSRDGTPHRTRQQLHKIYDDLGIKGKYRDVMTILYYDSMRLGKEPWHFLPKNELVLNPEFRDWRNESDTEED